MRFNPITWLTDRAIGQRGRFVVLALWLVAAGVLVSIAPSLASVENNKAANDIGNAESTRASALVTKEFPSQNGIPVIIVLYRATGLTAADMQTSQNISCWLISDTQRQSLQCPPVSNANRPANIGPVLSTFTVPQAQSQLISKDKTTMTIIATLQLSSNNSTGTEVIVKAIRDYTKTIGTPQLQIKVTGPGGILSDLIDIFASTNVTLLLTTVLLVLVLLIVIYRSPLLAILPLVGVGWALQIINGILGFAAKAGTVPVNAQITGILSVLLFGAGTDYVIFIVSRYREELQYQPDRFLALRDTMHGVGEAITSSAGTVILSLLALLLAVSGLYSALGLALAIAIAVMLVAGLTLVPAILSVLGRAVFWPFIPKLLTPDQQIEQQAKPERGFWAAIARFVGKRPAVAVVGSLTILGILALGYVGVLDDYNQLTSLRKPTQATDGFKLLADHFEPGTLAPFSVVINLKNNGDAYQQLVAIDTIQQAVANVQGVALVTGPTRPDGLTPTYTAAALQAGFNQLPQSLKDAIRSGQSIPSGATTTPGAGGPPAFDPQFIGLYAASTSSISSDNTTAVLQVTLNKNPYSKEALDLMLAVRIAANNAAHSAGLSSSAATVELSGVTPQLADTRAASDRDKMIIVPVVLLLVAIVLGLLLRSIIAPIYLLIGVTLNYFAALGLSSFIFIHFQGDKGVDYGTPLYTFIFLVALGADYTIFLMSRVREEAKKRGLAAGTQVALSRTGGVITSAGLILAGTFLVLTTLPLRTLSDFGTAVAVGILLDTFLVRGFLVPGTVLLLGKWNWWPSKLV